MTTTKTYDQEINGQLFPPEASEDFAHDADGVLTNDGRWVVTWDAEDRLVKLEPASGVPDGARRKLGLVYDDQNRQVNKKVSTWTGSAWTLALERRYLYDGWNLIAELDGSNVVQQSYLWGLDLSGSPQGAGGVGGLLAIKDAGQGVHFVAYDGNGNVCGLVRGADGVSSARYDYDPFGRTIRATGSLSATNHFCFSTKYLDAESGFLYYGQRYYNPSTGRWLSRDPIGERGGRNHYICAYNNAVNAVDVLGLHQFTLKKNPGRIERPRPWPGVPDVLMNGETKFWLLDDEWVEKVRGDWYVRGKGESTIGFWYSSPESETHELQHVRDDESVWNEFVSEADPYIDKPLCSKKKAECFREVVEKMGTLYRSRAEQKSARFDCDEYDRALGGKLGRCALADKLKPENDAYAIAIGIKILDCEAMK